MSGKAFFTLFTNTGEMGFEILKTTKSLTLLHYKNDLLIAISVLKGTFKNATF